MNLLVCLFILIIIFCARATDSVNYKRNIVDYENELNNLEDKRKQFLKECTDPYLEDTCLDECDAQGEDYKRLYEKIQRETGLTPYKNMIFLALMAEKNKIPRINAEYGINKGHFLINMRHREKVAMVERLHTFIVWYDNFLRENGFPHKMYLIKGNFSTPDHIELNDVTLEDMFGECSYGWELTRNIQLDGAIL